MQGSAFPHAIPLIGTIAGPRVGVVGPTSTINGFAADRNPKRWRSFVAATRAQQPKARAITMCWISLVPSPISRTFESQ